MTPQSAILATLTYSDHFGFPLTFAELHSRLLGISLSPQALTRTLHSLLEQKLIGQIGDYYFLPHRSSLVSRRLRRTRLSLPLYARADKLSRLLSFIPGVLAIYLTGSLALGNTNGDSDIDFLIVTAPGRLWTTRLFLTLFTSFLGLRRTPHSRSNSGKLCLNLYLTPTSYLLPPVKQNLYTAYELIQALPLYDPYDTHSSLYTANSWIKQYLPNYSLPPLTSLTNHPSPTINLIESLAYHLQLAYMRGKITRELITPDSAFFHPRDPGRFILHKLSLLK